MAKRLTDKELAERIRAANRKRAETRRIKLTTAGKTQMVVWIPDELRKQVDARMNGQTLSGVVADLLAAGLRSTTTPPGDYAKADPTPIDRAALWR